jgi:threonine dehydratase
MDRPDIPLARIEAARAGLLGRVHRTPMLSSVTAARLIAGAHGVTLADGRVFLKAEHLQRTGSFKPRGAFTRLASLTPAERTAGVITLSAGNAAQGYALAGLELGVPVTVVMPETAVRAKVDAVRGYGAEVVLRGSHPLEALSHLHELAEQRGLIFAHPFDDPDVIAGFGSIGLEILEDLREVDIVVVPVGGGGLISGIAAAVKQSRQGVRVYGVEPDGSNALALALEAGRPVPIVPRSVADGLGAPSAGEWTLAFAQRYVDGVVLVDDATILGGLRFAAERLKQVVEPAGAAALAAVLYGRVPLRDGDRVCAVLSGGNVAIERLGELLAAAAPYPGVIG